MLLQVLQILVWFAHIEDVEMGCRPHTYPHCPDWGDCNRSCGGGKRGRTCKSCVWRERKYFEEDCNQHCYNGGWYGSGGCNCPSWRSGSCCGSCRHIYIAHCKSGMKACGGSPDNIKCTECEDNYYSGGYGNGCKECSHIYQCRRRRCTSYSNTKCIECYNNKIFYKTTNGGRQCERMCASNNHYCWPGYCSNELTRGCSCAPHFKRIQHSGETSCQPNKLPSILTCGTVVVGPNMEKKQARSSTNSTECQYLADMYGNFKPSSFEFDLAAEYTIDIRGYTKPPFISESHFGITDFATSVVKLSVDGKRSTESLTKRLVDRSSSVNCKQTFFDSNNVSITSSKLQDGQALCLQFLVDAGGYLKSRDRVTHQISSAVPYRKVHKVRELCYRFDNTSPKHCREKGTCSYEPVQFESRVIRSTDIDVEFKGWYDPVPTGGNSIQASSIESYQITVNEVTMSTYNIQVNYMTNVYTKKVNFKENKISLNVTSEKPILYCVTLEVKDVADNVRQARRFILYDNSSFIETWDDQPFYFASASIQTNYKWQTHHHDICLNWKDHFLNRFYFDNPLLNPIASEPHGLVTGIYEQNDGVLPVSGTPNVHGIVQTLISWTLNDGSPSAEIAVPNFLNQSFCNDFNVQDGQTYIMSIHSIDIVNNSFIENRTLHIDRSVPHINNIWLVKDGYKVLFVHHMTDLSKMQLHFEALDPHSGVRQIEWVFGNTITELTSGSLIVGSFNETSCPQNAENCYCPDVGQCEFYNYTVPLNKLIAINKHVGNHNRNYYFTLKITNNAHLFNIERVNILVDDSPPEVGVIFEGPVDAKDIDYTSDDNFLVHWHGFIDHESGIKEYKIGLSSRCLSRKELYGFRNASDTIFVTSVPYTETSVRIPANFTGKRYVSLIALNNAMDPSAAVCSDGIVRDLSPPCIRNLTLKHATWSETLVCHEGQTWLFHLTLSKIKLDYEPSCNDLCENNQQHNSLASALPTRLIKENNSDVSHVMCGSKSWYQNNSIIYLPNIHIKLEWDIEEDESQIDDIFVGLGTDPTELNSPSIGAYKATLKRNSFKYIHEGIGSDEIFYIFLKVINKASQESVLTLGPILIDETPPICREIPNVIFQEEYIVVGWENDTFYDIEQDEEINSIYFEIGYASTKVTSLLKWDREMSAPCSEYSGGCFKYPIKMLQKQDNDLGLSFYITMHVYNKAGHFITVSTDTFKIPSTYPPGHGIVFDSDPENEAHVLDTNAHFTAHTLCLRWYGFKHHESIKIEVGIGSNNVTDNVVPYRTVNRSISYHCIKSPKIEFHQTYYALVKASCTGGFTVSSSNGIVILNGSKLLNSLHVNLGEECSSVNQIYSKRIDLPIANYSVTFPAHVGKRYKLFVYNSTIDSVVTYDGIIENDTESNNTFTFISFVEYPNIWLHFISETGSTNKIVELSIHKCPYANYLTERKGVTAHWFYDDHVSYGLTFQIAILRMKNVTDNLTAVPFKQYESAFNRQTFKFQNIGLEHYKFYKLAVKQCTNVTCLNPVFSDSFSVTRPPETGKLIAARLLKDTYTSSASIKLDLKWDAFHSDNLIRFYQWAVSKDNTGKSILTEWQTIKDTHRELYQVHISIDLPVHHHSTKFGCIRAFDKAENEASLCQQIEYITNGTYMTSTVYDFDSNAIAWNKIKNILHSSNIGSLYTLLHDNELDFGTPDTEVVGAILYASERNITWLLMEDPSSCDFSKGCVVEKVTNTGFVSFEKTVVKFNTFYYICAYSVTTSVIRELNTEVLDEINTCSNGFILDSIAPVAGKVEIHNNNGFLASLDDIEFSWNKFEDNIDATQFGYLSNIATYTYGVGSRPLKDDIIRFTNVGYKTRYVINSLDLHDGASVFVTIKANDHAGNTASASSNEVIIDTSPPLNGEVQISTREQLQDTNLYLTDKMISVHLSGFKDIESGHDHFEIGIGTQPFFTDILSTTVLRKENFVIKMQDYGITDGHTYYIAAKAINRAGLSSEFTYLRTIADTTPPNGGHVLEGPIGSQIDEDYQYDITEINVHWNGFSDPHSGIAFYRVALGTKPFSENIKPFVNVGLLEYTTWHGEFSIGEKYFTTVEACNDAGLCIARASDGITLDISPPTPGSVQIGSDVLHQKYQSHTSSVHVTWAGFEDPESSIGHYEMCIGTIPEKCDILERTNCLLRSNIIKTGLSLPLHTHVFATVTAFNKLSLNVTKSSDSFFVDETPPLVLTRPFFIVEENNNPWKIGQWDRSVLHIQWEFIDEESPIVRHYVSLATHHEGHTPVENIQLGAENNFKISLDGRSWLHNGDTYFVTVTGCNMAGLCISESTNDLIVDSTPPHLGGFKLPMYWDNFNGSVNAWKSNITLSWYGFHDQESEIERYFITISKTYSGNEITNGVTTVNVNVSDSKTEHSYTFLATDHLERDDKLYLTIWAENSVGLKSSLARASVFVLSSSSTADVTNQRGTLELEKHSCDIHYCNKDCTCAIIGKPCVEVLSNSTCEEIGNPLEDVPEIQVFNGLNEKSTNITASSACLSGSWKVIDGKRNTTSILRFEWSMGLQYHHFGEGIFDLKNEIPWNDVGLQSQVLHCLPVNRSLIAREKYVIYVRAWLSSDNYATFHSAPILVDHSPPSLVRGRTVLDSNELCNVDFDIIDWMDTITVCWHGVFSEQQGTIVNYFLAMGTYPSGDDTIQRQDVGLNSSFTFSNLSLTHGTKYFFSITAYNNVDLHSLAVSDGFIVDMDEPISGVVYNTPRHRNAPYQSSTTTIGLSWHGFQDKVSGVRNYYVAISDTPTVKADINFTNTGLSTRHIFRNLELKHGHTYYGFVKSLDNVGHQSIVAVSNGIKIDNTPPTAYICQTYADIKHVSEVLDAIDNKVNISFNATLSTLYKVVGYLSLDKSDEAKLVFHLDQFHTFLPLMEYHNQTLLFEHTFLSHKTASQTILVEYLNANKEYLALNMTLYECIKAFESIEEAIKLTQISRSTAALELLVTDNESPISEIQIGAGTTPGGFQVKSLSRVHHFNHKHLIRASVQHRTNVYVTAIVENKAGQRTVFKSKPLTIDHTKPVVKHLSGNLRYVEENVSGIVETRSIVHATWDVVDDESGISICYCSIGHRPGLQNIDSNWIAQTETSCESDEHIFSHGQKVFLNLKCFNNAWLSTEDVFGPLVVSLQQSDTLNAKLAFIPLSEKDNRHFTGPVLNLPVQSNHSCLQFKWNGFTDLSGIVHYEYRVYQDEHVVLKEWEKTVKDMVKIENIDLINGEVIAEVRAINKGSYISDSVNASLFVAKYPPKLSGISAKFSRNGAEKLHLSWADVFNIEPSIQFSFGLTIGTRKGYTDVLEIHYISDDNIDVPIPRSTIITPIVKEVFVSIDCIYETGLRATYATIYKLA